MYATFLAKYYPNVASAMIVAIRMHARALSHKIIIKCSAQFKSLFCCVLLLLLSLLFPLDTTASAAPVAVVAATVGLVRCLSRASAQQRQELMLPPSVELQTTSAMRQAR